MEKKGFLQVEKAHCGDWDVTIRDNRFPEGVFGRYISTGDDLFFRENRIAGLRDKRGRTKPAEELSEVERLRAENRLLAVENKSMELENTFLKKLGEIERRRS